MFVLYNICSVKGRNKTFGLGIYTFINFTVILALLKNQRIESNIFRYWNFSGCTGNCL